MRKDNLDVIVADLNKLKNISSILLDRLEYEVLTEGEKNYIKTYKPEKSLIIYGTLAPNRPNYSVVEHIKGEWKKGIVRGKLESKGWGAELGYYGFNHCREEEQQEIEAFILLSDELVNNWKMLDEFEGEGYKRILAKYELDSGELGIGYIYAINEDNAKGLTI